MALTAADGVPGGLSVAHGEGRQDNADRNSSLVRDTSAGSAIDGQSRHSRSSA